MKGLKFIINQELKKYKAPKGQYGAWHSSYENTLEEVKIVIDVPDAITSLDVKVGDEVFAVWVEYSQGDSFGNGYKTGIEEVGVFFDKKCAEEIEKFLFNTKKQPSKEYVEFNTSDGQVFKFNYFPWVGYFENLEAIQIDSIILT